MTRFHDFLLKQSASSDAADTSLSAETSPLISVYNPYVTKLCQKTTFLLSGPDVFDFLQGQLTADCRELGPQKALPTALCNPKGRTIVTALVEKVENGYLLSAPSDMANALQAHLQKYILFSKVTLERKADDLLLEAGGEGIETILSNHLETPISITPYSVTNNKKLRLISLPGTTPRWQIRGNREAITALGDSLVSFATAVHYSHSDYLDLTSFLVTIDEVISEQFLPNMFGYDLISGMSLKKGCYAGQEVLARSSHLGKIKRHLYHGLCQDSHTLVKGDSVITDNGQVIGTIVASSDKPEHQDILAIVRTPDLEKNPTLTAKGSSITQLKRANPSLDRHAQ